MRWRSVTSSSNVQNVFSMNNCLSSPCFLSCSSADLTTDSPSSLTSTGSSVKTSENNWNNTEHWLYQASIKDYLHLCFSILWRDNAFNTKVWFCTDFYLINTLTWIKCFSKERRCIYLYLSPKLHKFDSFDLDKNRHVRLSVSENCRLLQVRQVCANVAGPRPGAFAPVWLSETVFLLCAAHTVQHRPVQDPRTAETPNTVRGESPRNTHSSKQACN